MILSIISAIAKNNAIGYKGDLCFRIKKDLRHFKELTTGHTVIMGYNTFVSLPSGALPNRRNIVLCPPDKQVPVENYETLEEALKACRDEDEVFIIGGGMLYKTTINMADKLYLTEIDRVPENADTFFPEFHDKFKMIKEEEQEEGDIKFYFREYVVSMSIL